MATTLSLERSGSETVRVETIYLIDDSEDEVFMARIFFERHNLEIDLAPFAKLGHFYDHMGSPDFDPLRSLVVVDLNLTLEKGTAGVEVIRTMDGGGEMLVGISTGSEDPADRQSAERVGVDFFIGKPLDPTRVEQICNQVDQLSLIVAVGSPTIIERTLLPS